MADFVEFEKLVIDRDCCEFLERAGLKTFDDFMDFQGGTRVCHKRGRSVFRFEVKGRAFYLKRNRLHPVEVWKALSRFRIPSLGARTEWENILALQTAGIPTVTPVAMGESLRYGIETASFTLTEEIYDAEPLDRVLRRDYAGPLTAEKIRQKSQLIQDMAALARKFHGGGMNHQDFYLNHFFRDNQGILYLLDLQRVQRRKRVPSHFLIKDLAQLYYSADVYGVGSRSDRMLFIKNYLNVSKLNKGNKRAIKKIIKKVSRIARHDAKLLARRRNRGEL